MMLHEIEDLLSGAHYISKNTELSVFQAAEMLVSSWRKEGLVGPGPSQEQLHDVGEDYAHDVWD